LLIGVVAGVLYLEKHRAFSKIFHYLPAPFWCYFVPMCLASFGLLPEKSGVYSFLTTYLLAACLILLLLNINLPSILRLGPTALGAMGVGSVGIAAGAIFSYAIFGRWLPEDTWKSVGALSASWTGGSINMLAVKEGLQTPEEVFAPMVIVDTVVTYTWMAVMIALSGFQNRWDAWVRADRSLLEDVMRRLGSPESGPTPGAPRSSPLHAVWLIGASLLIGAGCLWLARKLPASGVLNVSGWAFLMVTAIGILLSFTPASQLERYGASRWGYLCLYLLLAAIGSRARLQHIIQAPLFIAMAVPWVLIHAGLLALYGRLRRVPMFFLATASQANIGGTASAPIVAGIYQPRLASIGLLLAIAANVFGTYAGYLIAYACRSIQ
jgi:uncharacterized membrane protein